MFAPIAASVSAQSTEIRGEVSFKGGLAIPEGHIGIYLEDPSEQDSTRRSIAETGVESDGKSTEIVFAISRPESATVSPRLQIVVRLERADGWLIARGSARPGASSAVRVTLSKVIY